MAENKNSIMAPTIVMSGPPGKMASLVADTILTKEKDMSLRNMALTGSDQSNNCVIGKELFLLHLFGPEKHEKILSSIINQNLIVVDFTQPDVVNRNAKLYCKLGIPFVMGTTGGDRSKLEQTVIDSGNTAVIAPNMAKPIVVMQAMLEYAAQNFPGALKGYNMSVVESHQASKLDTSGTAKAMVSYFQKLGIDFDVKDIDKIRDRCIQNVDLGIPNGYLDGHGHHNYILDSGDKTVHLEFIHNVNGRQVYADGTIDAVRFLYKKLGGEKGKVYTMIDVLKGD